MSLFEKARAKINLHLEVFNKRADGFHDIFSIMSEVELHDNLKLTFCEVSEDESQIQIDIVNSQGVWSGVIDEIPVKDNFVSIAAEKFLRKIGYGGRLQFEIEKNIPSGAGLGGGSSDAAAALRLIKRQLKIEENAKAYEAACETGSDVPFFLVGSTALAESRGELLTPIDFKPEGHVLLVNPGININTGKAYGKLSRSMGDKRKGVELSEVYDKFSIPFASRDRWPDFFKNDFEDVCFDEFPVIGNIKDKMYHNGALFSLMAGSGSTVFGIFEEMTEAERLRDTFLHEGTWAVHTKFA